MNIVESALNLFRRDSFVRITDKGEYVSGIYWKPLSKIIRWLMPGEYIDNSTLWKAYREAHAIFQKLGKQPMSERMKDLVRLHSLRDALVDLSVARYSEKLEDLLHRIDMICVKWDPLARFTPSQDEAKIDQCLEVLLCPCERSLQELSGIVRTWNGEDQKRIASQVSEQFFVPLVNEVCDILGRKDFKPGLVPILPVWASPDWARSAIHDERQTLISWLRSEARSIAQSGSLREKIGSNPGFKLEAYQEAFRRVKNANASFISLFGQEEPLKILEASKFAQRVKTQFLIPFYHKQVANKSGRDFVLGVNQLQHAVADLNSICPGCCERDVEWSHVSAGCAEMLSGFFSHKKELSFKQPCSQSAQQAFTMNNALGEQGKEIEVWLGSLHNPRAVIESLSQHLAEGIYIGDACVNDTSLKIPFLVNEADKNLLLCWKLYKKLSKYFRSHGVQDADHAASSLLVLLTSQSTVRTFFSNLGVLGGVSLTSTVAHPQDEDRRGSFSFSCQGSKPILQWVQTFSRAGHSLHSGFFVTTTIHQEGEEVCTKIETMPCSPSGEGLHIEDYKGKYLLQKDSLWSRVRYALWSKHVFHLTQKDCQLFFNRIDADLVQMPQRAALSLYELKQNIVALLPQQKGVPLGDTTFGTILTKIADVMKSVGSQQQRALGEKKAVQIIESARVNKWEFSTFLQELSECYIDFWRENIVSKDFVEGFFEEVGKRFPDHIQVLQRKKEEVSSLVGERVFGRIEKRVFDSILHMTQATPEKVGLDAVTWAYDVFLRLLEGLQDKSSNRTQGHLEAFFMERGSGLFALRIQKEIAKGTRKKDIAQFCFEYVQQLQKLFPKPQSPLLVSCFEFLKTKIQDPTYLQEVLATVGSLMSVDIAAMPQGDGQDQNVRYYFRWKENWARRVFPSEYVRDICDAMRKTCGVRYGMALAKELGVIDFKNYSIVEGRERALSPAMFSQVMRGVFCGFDSRKGMDKYCSEYAKHLEDTLSHESLDEWFERRFKVFLSVPFTNTMEKIFKSLILSLSRTYTPERMENFSQKLSAFVIKEMELFYPENEGLKNMERYLKAFMSKELPESLKKIVYNKMRETRFSPGARSPRR